MALIGRSSMPPVLAQVEDLCADADPIEISAQFLGYVGLATSRQTNHGDHMRLVHEVRPFTYKGKKKKCEKSKNISNPGMDIGREINYRKLNYARDR